ncbi:hypothetical protein [Pontimicrobium sp. IMCC45349]|jgi:hypothetical protein|uniref:hypothetical protein n=1 Tax=Pontimicrobium sp. IMCC45349 TaxID=3391574 RepID=UPI00399FC997
MKTIKSLLVVTLMLTGVTINSQTLTPQQQERENNKVEILTNEEKWDIQVWFYQEIQKMNLDEETLNQYESYFSMYSSRMTRLDDKDKDYTYTEVIEKLDELVVQLNNKMKEILPQESYKIHEENVTVLMKYIKLKMEREDYLVKI